MKFSMSMRMLCILLAYSTVLATSQAKKSTNPDESVDNTKRPKNIKRKLDNIPEGKTIQCSNERLSGAGKIYRWELGELRHYPNGMVAKSWNPNWRGDIQLIDCTDLHVGSPITIKSIMFDNTPEGTSIQCANENTGRIYRWELGELRHYPSGMVAKSWNPNWRGDIKLTDCTDLQVGSPMTLKNIPEGEGIRCTEKNDGKVYRWTNNKLQHYPSGEIARSWDPHWYNHVIDLNCESYIVGPPMSLNYPTFTLKDYGTLAHVDHSPLQLCEGNCEIDSHCADGLICFQRDGFTPVPGCSGEGEKDYDYCINKSSHQQEIPSTSRSYVRSSLKDYGASAHVDHSPLQLCEGNCDIDSHCADGLICFQRDGFTPVPGCSGEGKKDYDYCIINKSSQETPTAPPICSLLDEFSTQTKICQERVSQATDFISIPKDYYKGRLKIADNANNITKAINTMDATLDTFGPVLYRIPNIGPLIKNLGKILDNVKKVVQNIGDNREKIEKKKKDIGKVYNGLKAAQTILSLAANGASKLSSDISREVEAGADSSCLSVDLSALQDYISEDAVSTAVDIVSKCSVEIPVDLDLNLPELPNFDSQILTDITEEVAGVSDWVEDVVDTVVGDANYFMCCHKLGQDLTKIGEVFGDLTNLLSCPVNGIVGGVLDETFDVLIPLLYPLVDDLNEPIDNVNTNIEKLSNAVNVEFLPSATFLQDILWFDEDQCRLRTNEISGSIQFTFNAIGGTTPQIDHITLGDADGSFDFNEIANAVADECEEAANALARNDYVDCCPAARVNQGILADGWSNGHSCNFNPDCNSTVCDVLSGGNCIRKRRNGEGCSALMPCEDSLACLAGQQKCTNGDINSPCTIGSDCNSNLFCDVANGFKCVRKRRNGEGCSAVMPCESSLACLAAPHQKCTDGKIDSLCIIRSDCDSGLGCNTIDAKCVRKRRNGEGCSALMPCEDSLACLAGQQKCTNGHVNSPCTIGSDCNSNLFCDVTSGFKCVRKRRNGEGCSALMPCESSLACLGPPHQKCTDGNKGSLCLIRNDCTGNLKCPITKFKCN